MDGEKKDTEDEDINETEKVIEDKNEDEENKD